MSSYARHAGAMAAHGNSPNFSAAQLMPLVSHPGSRPTRLAYTAGAYAGSEGTNSLVATLFADRFTNSRQVVGLSTGRGEQRRQYIDADG